MHYTIYFNKTMMELILSSSTPEEELFALNNAVYHNFKNN